MQTHENMNLMHDINYLTGCWIKLQTDNFINWSGSVWLGVLPIYPTNTYFYTLIINYTIYLIIYTVLYTILKGNANSLLVKVYFLNSGQAMTWPSFDTPEANWSV